MVTHTQNLAAPNVGAALARTVLLKHPVDAAGNQVAEEKVR